MKFTQGLLGFFRLCVPVQISSNCFEIHTEPRESATNLFLLLYSSRYRHSTMSYRYDRCETRNNQPYAPPPRVAPQTPACNCRTRCGCTQQKDYSNIYLFPSRYDVFSRQFVVVRLVEDFPTPVPKGIERGWKRAHGFSKISDAPNQTDRRSTYART